MFKKLTNWLTGHKKKETERRRLKEQVCQKVAEVKEKAKKGDSDAQLKLARLEETITEQSIRLTGYPKPPATSIVPGGLK